MASCIHCEHAINKQESRFGVVGFYCCVAGIYMLDKSYNYEDCNEYYPDLIESEEDFKYIPAKYHKEYDVEYQDGTIKDI